MIHKNYLLIYYCISMCNAGKSWRSEGALFVPWSSSLILAPLLSWLRLLACLEPVTHLGLGIRHLLAKGGISMEAGYTAAGYKTAGINIALEVVAYDDTALTELPSITHDGVLTLRTYLGQEQPDYPSCRSMT